MSDLWRVSTAPSERKQRRKEEGCHHQDGPDRHKGSGPRGPWADQASQRPRTSGGHQATQEEK